MTYVVWRRRDGFISANSDSHGKGPSGVEVYGTFQVWQDARICIIAKRLEQGWQPLWVTVPNLPNNEERDRPGPIGIACETFLLCTNEAEMLIDHPTLKKVPACKRCARVLGHIPPET